MPSYLCGLDIGGTFTDCVLMDDSGRLTISKAPSTPGNFADGVLEALRRAGERVGLELPALLASITMLAHGTTAGTNAIIQRKGAKVGLITTRGHNDVIHIMRGSRGLSGQDIKLIVHIPESSKPEPIIPKRLIRGVSERVDCFGQVVVELNEDEVREAIRSLVDAGIEALAVCFLWSFLAPAHEARVKAIAAEIAPQLYVTCSHELAPKWGEYERTTAVALNAYIGPLTVNYVTNLDRRLKEMGYTLIGLDGEADLTLAEALVPTKGRPLALVMGAEGPGLRERTRETCDVIARIPYDGAFGSLNVSNAAAVSLYAAATR